MVVLVFVFVFVCDAGWGSVPVKLSTNCNTPRAPNTVVIEALVRISPTKHGLLSAQNLMQESSCSFPGSPADTSERLGSTTVRNVNLEVPRCS